MAFSSILLFISINCVLVSTNEASAENQQRETQFLSSINQLINLADKQIHHVILEEQIVNHKPVLKSLQTRTIKSLDGQYDFCFDKQRKGFAQNWPSKSLKLTCPQDTFLQMPVPSAFNSIPSLEWAKNYIGWFWYQKTFVLNEDFHASANHQLLLHFENVNYLALVWLQPLINEQSFSEAILVGSHVGGHLPFMMNLSEKLLNHTTSSGRMRFRLTIAVNNKLDREITIPSGQMVDLSEEVGHPYERFEPDFDFFHFAGILGSIDLVKLPPVHLNSVVQVREESNRLLSLNVCFGGNINSLAYHKEAQVSVKLFDLDDSEIITSRTMLINLKEKYRYNLEHYECCHQISLRSHKNKNFTFQNWTLANGQVNHIAPLYLVNVELIDGDSNLPTDMYEFRVAFNAQSASNNIQLQGFGLHHEQLFSGRTMSLPAIMKDIYLLKQMGVNLIRTSHYPYSSQFLDACDQHGILVIAECPAVGLNTFGEVKLKLHKQILLEMMERDNHHPSILMWSVANEPSSQLVAAKAYFEQLTEYARNELKQYTVSKQRPLTAAIAQPETADLIGETLDVIMVNRYMGWYEATGVLGAIRKPLLGTLCGWTKRLPGKPLLISEFGAEALGGLHRWSPADIYSEEYQRDLLIEHEHLFDDLYLNKVPSNCSERINFLGSMVWNFADFSTHQSLTRIGNLNHKGVFTRDREPKLAAEALRRIYLNRFLRED